MPFDGAERYAQLTGDVRLLPILEVKRDHNPSLQPGKVRNLCPEPAEDILVLVETKLGIRIRKQFRNRVARDADDAVRRAAVIVAKHIVGDCP